MQYPAYFTVQAVLFGRAVFGTANGSLWQWPQKARTSGTASSSDRMFNALRPDGAFYFADAGLECRPGLRGGRIVIGGSQAAS
jgi:hypothetical protein